MHSRGANLRTWMTIILVCGLLFAWDHSQRRLGGTALLAASDSHFAWMLCFATGFVIARRFGPIVCESRLRTAVALSSAVFISAGLYLAWAYYRATYFVWLGVEERLPYPDKWLNALELWFDVRHPVRRGSTKWYGEWRRVKFVVGTAIIVIAAVSGLLVGVHSNKPEGQKMSRARIVEVIVATAGLTLLAPVILFVAMGVRLNSSGTVVVRSTTRREDGSALSFVRFRTNDPDSNKWTEFGLFLRRHSLDRLPALVSLLVGETTLREFWHIWTDNRP